MARVGRCRSARTGARGADVNAKDTMQDSPYLFARAHGRLAILRMTLGAGADLKTIHRIDVGLLSRQSVPSPRWPTTLGFQVRLSFSCPNSRSASSLFPPFDW